MSVKVGDNVWVFDINRRVYRRSENGKAIGGPIWKEHWVKRTIISETSRSWIIDCGVKITKKNAQNVCYSLEEIERRAFVHDNQYKISEAVKRVGDYDLLIQIAKLINYKTD